MFNEPIPSKKSEWTETKDMMIPARGLGCKPSQGQ